MKRIIAVILAIVMVCSLAACGGDEKNNTENKTTCFSVGCDNSPLAVTPYCGDHACVVATCNNEKINDITGFCSYHQCEEPGCTNQHEGAGTYCNEHECAKSLCYQRKGLFSDYCYLHNW